MFDGKNPPYEVDSEPNPLNKYGISKLAGEKVVLEANQGRYSTIYFIGSLLVTFFCLYF